jgi:hypothetical protein
MSSSIAFQHIARKLSSDQYHYNLYCQTVVSQRLNQLFFWVFSFINKTSRDRIIWERYIMKLPVTVCTACTVSARSELGIMGSNPTQGMEG